MYFLDTTAVIDYFRDRGRVGDRLLAREPREVALPAVVLYELEVGAAKSSRPDETRRQIDELTAVVAVTPFAEGEARAAARIRTALEAHGTPIGPHDVLIAATALANGGILVSRNTRELSRVEGLRLEDWY
jgi:tRNA(fMet)-specific endonuclease VapC